MNCVGRPAGLGLVLLSLGACTDAGDPTELAHPKVGRKHLS
jgi:hypothetical protein